MIHHVAAASSCSTSDVYAWIITTSMTFRLGTAFRCGDYTAKFVTREGAYGDHPSLAYQVTLTPRSPFTGPIRDMFALFGVTDRETYFKITEPR